VTETLALVGTAAWLGILTSISPCPLATNIAAISFIGRDVESPRRVLLSGLLYAVGRSVAYVVLGMVLVASLVNAPGLSQFLQKYMNMVLGPLLVLAGMFLLDLIQIGGSGRAVSAGLQERARSWGVLGAVLLGAVFALSFCPLSAGLFFVSLIPLAVKQGSGVLLPLVYGVGTAIPVIAFAVVIAMGARSLGGVFQKTSAFATWARRVTGVVFVLVGIYLALVYVYEVL
jgi:cytochrome c biogenesis protein CcdA